MIGRGIAEGVCCSHEKLSGLRATKRCEPSFLKRRVRAPSLLAGWANLVRSERANMGPQPAGCDKRGSVSRWRIRSSTGPCASDLNTGISAAAGGTARFRHPSDRTVRGYGSGCETRHRPRGANENLRLVCPEPGRRSAGDRAPADRGKARPAATASAVHSNRCASPKQAVSV